MLKEGFKKAQEITRKNAKTFYLTSLFLPQEKRLAAYTVYAICRFSDDSVDDIHLSLKQKEKELAVVRQKVNDAFTAQPASDPLLLSFQKTIERYGIPKKYFDDLLDGMAMDLTKTRYQNFEELYLYSYRVAGVIGLIMLKIFEYDDPAAEACAVDLGLALQLTNISRDVQEDFHRGRIYLPQDEMAQFCLSDNDIKTERVNKNFEDFMRFQIKRARDYFFRGSQGLRFIKNRRCQFVAFLILEFYAKFLEKIERNNFNVYRRRIFIPRIERLCALFYLLWRFAKKSLAFRL